MKSMRSFTIDPSWQHYRSTDTPNYCVELFGLAWCYWGPRKLLVTVSQLLTGVANAINGIEYPKGAFASIQFNACAAIMHTCRKVTITR